MQRPENGKHRVTGIWIDTLYGKGTLIRR